MSSGVFRLPVNRILDAYEKGRDERLVFITRQGQLPQTVVALIKAFQDELRDEKAPKLHVIHGCGDSFNWPVGEGRWIRGVLASPSDLRALQGVRSRDGTHVYVCDDVMQISADLVDCVRGITLRDCDSVSFRYDDLIDPTRYIRP